MSTISGKNVSQRVQRHKFSLTLRHVYDFSARNIKVTPKQHFPVNDAHENLLSQLVLEVKQLGNHLEFLLFDVLRNLV